MKRAARWCTDGARRLLAATGPQEVVFLVGLASLARAGWLVWPPVGWAVVGVVLLWVSVPRAPRAPGA